jgi:uncharacterized protein involved in response to NO
MTEQFVQETSPGSDPQVQKAATPWYGYVMPAVLGALYLLFLWLEFSYMNMTRWPWAPILSGGLLMASGWGLWQLRRLDRPFRGLGNGLDWAALLWVIALVASTIFSHVPHRSHWYLVMALSYIAALYALNNWLDSKKKIENLTIFLVSSSLFFSCNSLYQYIFKKWLPYQDKDIDPGLMVNTFPLGHQNFVAGFLVLTLPVAVGIAFYYKDWRRGLGIGTVLLGLWIMVSTASRGGFLGLGAGLASSLLVILLIDWSWKKVKIGASAISGLFLLIAILWNLNANLRSRTVSVFAGQDLNILSRNWAWAVGYREWQANPWFGVGIGANPYTFEQYQQGMKQYPWSQMVFQQLHNSWVQTGAELGSLGQIAILITLGILIRIVWKLCHSSQLNTLLIAVLCGLVGYGAMSLTDYQLEVPAISMTLLILGSLVASLSQDLGVVDSWPENIRKVSALLWISSLAAAVAVLIPIHRALYESNEGFAAYQKGDLPSFYDHLVKAVSLNVDDAYYPLQLSLVMQKQGLLQQNSKRQEEYYERGAFWGEKAAHRLRITYTYENTGWAYIHLQKYGEAEKFFRETLEINPTSKNSAYLGLAASLLKQESKKEEGISALAKYLFMNPEFFRDGTWENGNSLPKYFLPATDKLLILYNRMLSKYPEDIDLLYNKAMVYYVRGEYSKASSLLDSIPQRPEPVKYIEGDGTTSLPYVLTPARLEKTKSCLKKHSLLAGEDKRMNLVVQTEKSSKLGFVFPSYDAADYFMFRHVGGVPTEIIWPVFPDQSKFVCGIPIAGGTRFILPR